MKQIVVLEFSNNKPVTDDILENLEAINSYSGELMEGIWNYTLKDSEDDSKVKVISVYTVID